MAKRRTAKASARDRKRAARAAGEWQPSGTSAYAQKRARQARGKYSAASPFTCERAEQARESDLDEAAQ